MFVEDVIDEVEFSMLFETINKKNPSFPYLSYDRFDLTRVTDEECKAEFWTCWITPVSKSSGDSWYICL